MPNWAGAWNQTDEFVRAIFDCTRALTLNADAAITDYDRALKLAHACVGARLGRAAARRAKGDFDKSIADFTEAIRLALKDAAGY